MRYLYTDDCDHIHSPSLALQLVANAGYLTLTPYDAHRKLINHCAELVFSVVNVENCVDILRIVYVEDSPSDQLQQSIITFILHNYEDVAATHQLEQLPLTLFQRINVAFNLMILHLARPDI